VNIANIQTFLCVVRNQSISLAAQELYISQPTVSARLRQLEEDLGITLIHRRKGVRSIELTPEGVKFIPLAERWAALSAETAGFAAQSVAVPFTVASPDSLNLYLLQPLLRQLAEEDGLSLRIRTQQSPEIFSLIDSMEADAGFVFHLSRSVNVVCKPLFSEKMVLLCSKNGDWPNRPITPAELDPRHERFLAWSQDLQLWHDSWWNPAIKPYVQVDNAALLTLFMDEPHSWALCPASVADALLKAGHPVEPHTLTQCPPDRTCYYLTGRTLRSGPAAAVRRVFQTRLLEHLTALSPLIRLHPSASALLGAPQN